jgi:hypothetical protein
MYLKVVFKVNKLFSLIKELSIYIIYIKFQKNENQFVKTK